MLEAFVHGLVSVFECPAFGLMLLGVAIGRALGAALMSSLVGAAIGAFALAAMIPIVQPLVLSLGTPEFFMLAMVGIAFVASLSGGAVRRGLIAGGLGLLLSLVGLDPQSGTQRFPFGQL